MPKSTSAPAATKAADEGRAARRADESNDAATGRYDAIVIGGGHNGLVNGAYLAKAGLRTLVLERRHLVGGAAITEELRPGFWFTTFSYALSLLRPDIIHDLDLVKHGFMPLLMPSTFCPMENGDYLLLGQDHGENQQEIARHSAARRRRLRRVQPRRQPGLPGDQAAARPGRRRTSSATTPRSSIALAALGSAASGGSTRRSSTTPSGC